MSAAIDESKLHCQSRLASQKVSVIDDQEKTWTVHAADKPLYSKLTSVNMNWNFDSVYRKADEPELMLFPETEVNQFLAHSLLIMLTFYNFFYWSCGREV
jgi:hypothetical protein